MTTTQVPASRVAIVDGEGKATPAFYRFLQTFFQQAGQTTIPVSDIEQMLVASQRPAPAPPPPSPDPAFLLARIAQSNLSQADVMQIALLFQRQESAVQQLRARIEQLEAFVMAGRVATQ